ncbi:MAG: fructose-bisphosphate aldolase, class II [Parcubacteria group bacterium Gr01-1014_38]|nr:MAG: fructose-bisphosphate aldolase, class II [Parcubacteria group bacterium Gr01-1014_38]
MPLVAPQELFARALRERWALGAFNTSNLEVTQAIAWALQEANAPGIIQTSEAAIKYAGLETLRDIIRDVAASVTVPLVLHLDHGKSLDIARQCIKAGYGSVMIDGSALPLPENIALSKQVVELAHARNIWVEGEVGAIPGKEALIGSRESGVGSRGDDTDDRFFTKPEEAAEFARETGVDALAVSVGTAHGAFRGREGIRFERLQAIRDVVSIPLTLHGASGLPDDEIRRALEFGIVKVNIDTELREAFHDTLTKHQEDGPEHSIDPRSLLKPARDAVQKVVKEKVSLLGSEEKAS